MLRREDSKRERIRSLITRQEEALRRYEAATRELLAACSTCANRSWVAQVVEGRWLRHNHIGITLSERRAELESATGIQNELLD
jgi:hypothetical protein